MTAWDRRDAAMAIAIKAQYDAEQHNICLALVRFSDGSTDALAAIEPSQRFGCQGMGQFHTEPKLLNYLCAAPNVRKTAVGA